MNFFQITVIRKNLLIIFISISLLACFGFTSPIKALSEISVMPLSQGTSNVIASLKYEVKESSSLTDPITDPNFNVMREKELGKSLAIPLVLGVLIIAVIAPLATWWYFSK